MPDDTSDIREKVFYGLFWKFTERILAQMVSLLVSIVLARMLMPEDYGAVSIIMVFITIANVFVSSGFGNALIQKKEADNLDFSSVFYINILLSLFLYFLLFIFAPIISNFYDLPILVSALRVLGIRIPVAAINSVQHAYVSRHMLFKRFFLSTLFGTVISGIIGIFMAYHGFGVWALVFQYLTNTCTDTLVLWVTVRWRPQFIFSWDRAKTLLSFGWKLLFSSLLDTGYNQIRSLIIGKKYTKADLAFYTQGDKYPNLIVVNINSSISSVIFPALSQYQDDVSRIKQMTRRAIQVGAYIMWPMMIGLSVIAEILIRIILTDKWLPCVPYLRIFCFSYGLWPIHTANLQALKAIGRSDLFLKLELIKKCIGLVLLLVSMRISPLAMAGSLIVSDIAAVFINAAPNRKLLEYGYVEQFKDLLPPLFMAVIMATIIYPISFLKMNSILIMILQVLVGVTIYVIESVLFKSSGFIYLTVFLKKRRRN